MPDSAKTVDAALALLLELGDGGPGSAAALARRTGLNRTVAHRLLGTLLARGFVRRDGSGPYDLGLALVDLAHRVRPELREVVIPALEALVERLGETAAFAVADGGDAVALEEVRASGHIVHVDYRPGLRHPLWQGAHGRAILAFLPDPTVERVVTGAPGNPVRDLVEKARARGYATSRDELQPGVAGVAAPVRATAGTVLGSVGVVYPVSRQPTETTLARAVLDAAESIDKELTRHRVRLTA
ncbi:MAG: IclR family transcriptional regulator [Streptosporangiaceae bacterium]